MIVCLECFNVNQITKPKLVPSSCQISPFSVFNLKSNRCCLLSHFFLTYAAPTLPPTTQVPSTTPSDECDDDQASCHSGTGDDYDVTGANIALMRLQANPLLPFLLLLLTLDLLHFPSFTALCHSWI